LSFSDTKFFYRNEKGDAVIFDATRRSSAIIVTTEFLIRTIKVGNKLLYEISNRFTALENLDAEMDNNRAWENIRENIKISAKEKLGIYELKKHRPLLDEGCSILLDQRKQDELQWLEDPSEINGDNHNNIGPKISRNFRNKKRKYLKDNINELATNSKNKNIRDLCRGIYSLLGNNSINTFPWRQIVGKRLIAR
jgi:hypothetical protein